jgi:2-(1,2-epoxy-1,2-dihydrophenyl)acetyl-CoA isomerase
MPTVQAVAAQFAAGPTRGFARSKQALYASSGLSYEGSLALEIEYQRELGKSSDYREGVAAFVAKRAPKFTGE